MLSDLRECVTGDTLVWLSDGKQIPICDLVEKSNLEVLSYDVTQNKLCAMQLDAVWEVGVKPVIEIILVNGQSIRVTAEPSERQLRCDAV